MHGDLDSWMGDSQLLQDRFGRKVPLAQGIFGLHVLGIGAEIFISLCRIAEHHLVEMYAVVDE